MRVAIDTRKIHDFGIGTYIRNLLRQLARIDQNTEYILLCREPDLGIAAQLGPNFRGVVEPSPNYSLREQIHVPWVLRRERPDVYHAPHYVLPPAIRCRSVVTIHDCIHLLFPQYLPNRMAFRYARFVMGSAIRNSSIVFTVSEASRADILRFYPSTDPAKVHVVPNAIDAELLVDPGEAERDRVRERYQIRGRFVLFAGNVKPHKNLERLIRAFARVRCQEGNEDLRLVLIGDDVSRYASLRRTADEAGVRQEVRFFGFVPHETLAALYRMATVFAFPSLYEGFGLPPLEAMACGTPVVTSRISSLPEVVGDGALLVDPYNEDDIAQGIARLLDDQDLRARLVERGLERAASYSWARSVRQIHAGYLKALGRTVPATAEATS